MLTECEEVVSIGEMAKAYGFIEAITLTILVFTVNAL